MDELAKKATFAMTLIGDFPTILGNMPAIAEQSFLLNDGDTTTTRRQLGQSLVLPSQAEREVRFATTPRMSTYLIGWAMCDWESSAPVVAAPGIVVRVLFFNSDVNSLSLSVLSPFSHWGRILVVNLLLSKDREREREANL